jgi:hypothetical protein
LQLTVVTQAAAHTVDFHLTAPDGTHTATFTRAMPNDDGTEFVFTLLLEPGASDDVVAEQTQNLEGELRLLKSLCEVLAAQTG